MINQFLTVVYIVADQHVLNGMIDSLRQSSQTLAGVEESRRANILLIVNVLRRPHNIGKLQQILKQCVPRHNDNNYWRFSD